MRSVVLEKEELKIEPHVFSGRLQAVEPPNLRPKPGAASWEVALRRVGGPTDSPAGPQPVSALHIFSSLVVESSRGNFRALRMCVFSHDRCSLRARGSPLQNLIIRGHADTKLTALRMTAEMDAGPVYFKESLSLEGNAEEIYLRAANLSAIMVRTIVQQEPTPVPQTGDAVIFTRRKPEESRIGDGLQS